MRVMDPSLRVSMLLIGISFSFLLGGCITRPRPDGIACNLHAVADPGPMPTPLAPGTPRSLLSLDRPVSRQALALRTLIQRNYSERQSIKEKARMLRPPAAARPGAPAPPPPGSAYSVLALSQGGQWGAYGGGFIQAWGDRAELQPNRDELDMITGVSTGAVMATYVYLGSSPNEATRRRYDEMLKAIYTGTIGNDLVRKRAWYEILTGANSVADAANLRAWIQQQITPELLAAVAQEYDNTNRLMFAGAVNADTGNFEYFDLTAIAKDGNAPCYASVLAAASAIPLALDPVFINGQMYIDGGARQSLFFVEQVAAAIPASTQKNLFGIVHSRPDVGERRTPNGLVGIASRTAGLLSNEVLLDSAYHVDTEARRLGFTTGWTSTARVDCPGRENEDFFEPGRGRCMWDIGFARARDQASPWKEFSQIRNP